MVPLIARRASDVLRVVMSGQDACAHDEMAAAVGEAITVLRCIADEGGVLNQIASGDWAPRLSNAKAADSAALIRSMTEHVRETGTQLESDRFRR